MDQLRISSQEAATAPPTAPEQTLRQASAPDALKPQPPVDDTVVVPPRPAIEQAGDRIGRFKFFSKSGKVGAGWFIWPNRRSRFGGE
jgi:hypothetical protein